MMIKHFTHTLSGTQKALSNLLCGPSLILKIETVVIVLRVVRQFK